MKKIGVVIITKDRWDDLERTINAFLSQTYDNKEIIVVDNASSDATRKTIKKYADKVKYYRLPSNLNTLTLNVGIALTDADVIWRTDDDSQPESETAFERIMDVFAKHEDIHIIATTDIEVKRGNMLWNWYDEDIDFDNPPAGGYPSYTFLGGGAGIRREVIEKIGGFWDFGVEELDFATRAILAGFNIRYFSNIRVLHFASPNSRPTAQRWVQHGKQLIRYQWQYFSFFKALGRSLILVFTESVNAVSMKINPQWYIYGIFAMINAAFQARLSEKQLIPKDMLFATTRGKSLAKNQYNYFKTRFLGLFRKK